jgi:hypothetical protein
MTKEKFKELLQIHEEIDDLRGKIISLERAKKYKPEMYIPKSNGDSIDIIHINAEKYLSIIVDEISKCQEEIERLTKVFENA